MELITIPTVVLVGKTQATDNLFDYMEEDPSAFDSDTLAEFGGRGCYLSFDKPNPATQWNKDYLANIINLGHESVLAHATANFYIAGVSRSLAQELIRSRFLAFSELSQRYVDVSEIGIVVPPDATEREIKTLVNTHEFCRLRYTDAVNEYMINGFSRKEARSAARAHLPLSTETRMLVSGNMRAWRDFLQQRLSPHADKEIQRLAHELLKQLLEEVAPHSFQDIAEEYGYDPRLDGVRIKWERHGS